MKTKRFVPTVAATALLGLSFLTLSGAAIAADNSMSHSGSMMSHNSMSKKGGMMAHNAMSGSKSMASSKVKKIQSALKKKGMNVKTDGIMGPSTMSALKKYQQKNGLKATGHPDKATLKSLGVSSGMSGQSMMKSQSHGKKWHHGDSSKSAS